MHWWPLLVSAVFPLLVSASTCPAADPFVYQTCSPPQPSSQPPVQQQPSAIPELLTFSEWRARHDQSSRRVHHLIPSLVPLPPISSHIASEQQLDPPSLSPKTQSLVPQQSSFIHPLPDTGSSLPSDPLVPLKSRTNYASLDCSASVQYSSPKSRGASSILNPSKDRYMLTPCNSEETFIIIELCDEIEIDTVVIANHEFFSSMFKHFRVRAAQTYVLDVDEDVPWTDLGTFRAGNIRGLQVFRTKPAPGFFRYLRVDFLSHYGSEHFCPISLLKVYGLNQLDAWRRDQARERFEADIIARVEKYYDADGVNSVFEEKAATAEETSETSVEPRSTHVSSTTMVTSSSQIEDPISSTSTVTTSIISNSVTDSASVSTTEPSASSTVSESYTTPSSNVSSSLPATQPAEVVNIPVNYSLSTPETSPNPLSLCALPMGLIFNQIILEQSPTCNISDRTHSAPESTAPTDPNMSQNVSTSSISSSSPESTEEPYSPRIISEGGQNGRGDGNVRNSLNGGPILSTGGINPSESIYGAIMKKISVLEQNATLSIRFMEEQSALLREAFVRMETRIGDMESQKIKQDQMVRRMILDLDFHRAKVEQDRIALASQVNMLSGEIMFTRKLGAAQLIGLCGLIIFVGLTRTSPSSPFMSYALPSPAEREYRARRDERLRKSHGHDVYESSTRKSHDRRDKDRPVPNTLMLRALSVTKRTPNRGVSRRPGTPSSLAGTSPVTSTSNSVNPFTNEKSSDSRRNQSSNNSSNSNGAKPKALSSVSSRRRSLTPPPQPTWKNKHEPPSTLLEHNLPESNTTHNSTGVFHQTPQTPTPSTSNHHAHNTNTNNNNDHSYKNSRSPNSPTSKSSSISNHRTSMTIDTEKPLPLSPESLSPSSRNDDSLFL